MITFLDLEVNLWKCTFRTYTEPENQLGYVGQEIEYVLAQTYESLMATLIVVMENHKNNYYDDSTLVSIELVAECVKLDSETLGIIKEN